MIDHSGEVFGLLTLLRRVSVDRHNNESYLALCRCGQEKVIRLQNLRSGNTKACGCLALAERTKHCGTKTSEYHTWREMRYRCARKTHPVYKHYGGRGIKVCKRWDVSFQAFLKDMGKRPSGLSLDRINNDGNYTPGNCRWTTCKVQTANRRVTRKT